MEDQKDIDTHIGFTLSNSMSWTEISPNEIAAKIGDVRDIAEYISKALRDQISEYATFLDRDSTDWLFTLTHALEDIEAVRPKFDEIEETLSRVAENVLGSEPGTAEMTGKNLRVITLNVSQGMINSSLLTLTPARKRRLVRVGERFKITLPGGETFETELVEPGNRLKERGRIRSFYEENKVKEDDEVALIETAPGEWKLVLAERERSTSIDEKTLEALGLDAAAENGPSSQAPEGSER